MALKISPNFVSAAVPSKPSSGGRNHTKARSLENVDLEKPGRLRVGHLMTLFSVSHSTLYKHIKHGQIPTPDGRDGTRPFWLTETVRHALGAIAKTQG